MTSDPWSTGGRTGYTPPPVQRRRTAPKQGISFGGILRTVLVLAAMAWAFNYAWHTYYLPVR